MDDSTYGYSRELLINELGVSSSTAYRWRREKRIPSCRMALMKLALQGDLGAINEHWSGFRMIGDELWTPEDVRVTTGRIRAIQYKDELIRI
ncbi:MAG: hypothetical protein ABUL58_08530, partial [Steroidobacter sp.]